MRELKIKAATTIEVNGLPVKKEVEGVFNVPSSTDEAVTLYGEKITFDTFMAALKVDAQDWQRRRLVANDSIEAIQAEAPNWMPGTKVEKSPVATALGAFDKMTPEEREKCLEDLRAMMESVPVIATEE